MNSSIVVRSGGVALHTAVCFGDRTLAARLAQLATQVDGPRAPAAAAHTRQDRRGSAQATTRAHRLAQACEGARTPALAALAAPLPLTTREREIVTLAATGLSNRQIAQRLVVSVRTVETTSTAPAPNSAPPIAPNSPPCSTATDTSCVPATALAKSLIGWL